MPREPGHRLFFALWPDEPMRQALARAIRKAACSSGGHPVRAENLHVTLAFLGSVPEGRLPELAAIAREAAGARLGGGPSPEALDLAFDHLEYWRAAQLLCALPAEAPPWVSALARGLQDLLARRGFASDLESSQSVGVSMIRPFRPHVTLARKVHRSPRIIEMRPVTWSFTDFVLVDSKTLPEASLYTVLERFSFARE